MQLITVITTMFLATSIIANPSLQPYSVFTRDDGTKSQVGGSIGCFGTDGNIREADTTNGYQATFYSEYSCSGRKAGPYSDNVKFDYPIAVKSIKLEKTGY